MNLKIINTWYLSSFIISIIVLILYIIPDITWGAYVFFKEASLNLKNIKI